MDSPSSFGTWLRQRRKSLDLTQEDLARQVGYSVSAIRKIESDERRPSRQVAELLARFLEVPQEQRSVFLKVARGERSAERLPGLPDQIPPLPGYDLSGAPLPPPANSAAGPAAIPPPPAALAPLPTPSTPLVGRQAELGQILALLANPECRLITLLGPGGIGKTRLALQAAHRLAQPAESGSPAGFPDGVVFVSLDPVTAPEFILPAIAASLGVGVFGAGDVQAQVQAFLSSRSILLVLDNLEQVLAGAGVLADLLSHAAHLKIIATSRERLNLHGEWVFEVQGLPTPLSAELPNLEDYSAIALFLQSARRARPEFKLSAADRPAVVRIAQLMNGVPLGIELAASWVRVLSCGEIVQEIERNLDFLAVSLRDLPERHRSLRAAFDYSWNLLTPGEQQALGRLAVFRGGFTRAGASQVGEVSLAVLSALVDKSLLSRNPHGRYEIHDILRQYAGRKLEESGQAGEARRRHLEHFLELAELAEPELWLPQQVTRLDELSQELNNLRTALEHSLEPAIPIETSLRLGGALWRFWAVRGHVREGREWLEKILDRPGAQSTPFSAKALNGAGLLAWRQGDYPAARRWTETCARLAEAQGDSRSRAYALALLSLLAQVDQQPEQALSLTEESIAAFRAAHDEVGLALSLNSLGELARSRGDDEQAAGFYRQSLELYCKLGHKRGMADLYHNLGYVALHQGETQQGLDFFQKSLDLDVEQGNRRGMAECLIGLATGLAALGRLERAASLYASAESQLAEIGAVLEPTDQAEYERNRRAVQSQMPPEMWQAAWEEGRSLSPALAIALAVVE